MKQWPKFKAGDRVWSALSGEWATLKKDSMSEGFFVDHWLYDDFGRLNGEGSFPMLFRNEIKPEDWPQPESPLPDLPVDALIMVRDNRKGNWVRRHFARWEWGKAACWDNGRSSFTTSISSTWNEWRFPTQEELDRNG